MHPPLLCFIAQWKEKYKYRANIPRQFHHEDDHNHDVLKWSSFTRHQQHLLHIAHRLQLLIWFLLTVVNPTTLFHPKMSQILVLKFLVTPMVQGHLQRQRTWKIGVLSELLVSQEKRCVVDLCGQAHLLLSIAHSSCRQSLHKKRQQFQLSFHFSRL